MDSINLSDNVCSIYVESCDSSIDKTSHVVVDDDDDDTTKGRNVMLMVMVVIISKQSFIINVNYNYYTHIDSGHNVIRRYAYASVSNVY